MRKALAIFFFTLLTISSISSLIEIEIVPVGKAAPTWYSIGGSGGDFNVNVSLPCGGEAGTGRTLQFFNGSLNETNNTSRENWYWMGQDASFGFLWAEMPAGEATTQKGRGVLSMVYADDDILILQRERNTTIPSRNHIITYYTFWKDKSYFAYEVYLESWEASPAELNQPNIGIYAGFGTYTYWRLDYDGNAVSGRNNGAIAVTQEMMKNASSLHWQTLTTNSNNRTVGLIPTYFDPPWLYASYMGAPDGEIQYQLIWSNPAGDLQGYVPTPQIYRSSYIVYLYDADDDGQVNGVYQQTKDLASQLWQSNVSQSQSWGQWDDWSMAYKWGVGISNRIGYFNWGEGRGQFEFKNSSTWRIHPTANGTYSFTPMFFAANDSVAFPNLALVNNTGTFYNTINDNTYSDHGPNNIVSNGTRAWLRWRANKAGYFDWDNYYNSTVQCFETWGDSDKFNMTIAVRTTNTQTGIKQLYGAFKVRSPFMGRNMQFNEITTNTTADYTLQEPDGSYTGVLFKKLEGSAPASMFFNSSGVYIFLVNNPTQQVYSSGTKFYIKFMVWLHYGQITSEGQITDYHTSPQLSDVKQYFARHPVNSNYFTVYADNNLFNSTATFPIMRKINNAKYQLLAIGSGNRTFTIFLNNTIFNTNFSSVSDVTSWNYNPSTGNFTFTIALERSKLVEFEWPGGRGLNLNVETLTADGTVLWNTTIGMYNGTWYNVATTGGWANFTGILDGSTVSLNASWLGVSVNNTLNTVLTSDTTLNMICRVWSFSLKGATRYIGTDRNVTTASWSNNVYKLTFDSSTTTNIVALDIGQKPTYVLGMNYDLASDWDETSGVFKRQVPKSTFTVQVSFDDWGDLYVSQIDTALSSLNWSGQILRGTFALNSTGTLKVYCGSRGNPVKVAGLTASYDNATKVLTATYTSDTFSLDWTASPENVSTPPPVTFAVAAATFGTMFQNQTRLVTITFTFSSSSFTVTGIAFQGAGAEWFQPVTSFPATFTGESGTLANGTIQVQIAIPAKAAPGNYTVQAEVYGIDPHGTKHSAAAPLSFIIEDPPSLAGVSSELLTPWIILGTVAIIAIATVALLIRRRRKLPLIFRHLSTRSLPTP